MRTLTVQTPSHQYPIFIGYKLIGQVDTLFQPYLGKKATIITNKTVAPLYLKQFQMALDRLDVPHFSIILPDGEKYKNRQTLNLIYDGLIQNRARRKTTLIALGGGVIGDMVGFAAAIYQCSAPFIQVPATLLSQVGSSIGGKTTINYPLSKNMIGTFCQSQAVLADSTAPQALPQRKLLAGMAEVIKYGALGDAGFFAWLEENMTDLMAQYQEKIAGTVYHCCKMKTDIVAQDETEQGIRAWLSLGHTFGHIIGAEVGYSVWLHGKAAAVGYVLASRLSQVLGKIRQADTERIAALMEVASLPSTPPVFSFEKWIGHMNHNKEVSSGIMRFVGLEYLSKANITKITDMEVLRQILQPYLWGMK